MCVIKCMQREESHSSDGSAGNNFPQNYPTHHERKERQSACWHWCLMQLMCFCKSPSSDTQAVKSQSGRQWAKSAGWWSAFFPQQNVMSHTRREPQDSVTSPAKLCHFCWMLWHIQLHQINDVTEKTLKSPACHLVRAALLWLSVNVYLFILPFIMSSTVSEGLAMKRWSAYQDLLINTKLQKKCNIKHRGEK